MTLPHPAALAMTVLSWIAIFVALAVYGCARLMAAALRMVLR